MRKKELKNNEEEEGKSIEKKDDKKEKKKSKKGIVIIILSIIILILLGVIFWFVYRNSLANKSTGSGWTDKYYEFIKEQNKSKFSYESFNKKSNISFVESDSMKYPMMIVKNDTKCGKNDCKAINVYGIVDDSVKFLTGQSASNVEVKLYYNIEKKDYKYYIHTENDGYEGYYSLDTAKYDYDNYNMPKYLEEKGIAEDDHESDEYNKAIQEFYEKQKNDTNREVIDIYKDDDKVTQKTLDGKELEYNKIDEELVDTGVEPKYFDYEKDMDAINIRKEIIEGKNDYKEIDSLLTKTIEKIVKEQIELVEKIKQDIENAKNEIKADEEKKAQEKAEREGFKVGSYTIKYGRYEWDLAELGDPGKKETYILRSDKTCTHTTYEGQTFSCTFRSGRATDGQSIESAVERDALIIKDNGGYERSFFPKDNGFRDTDLENFIYKGTN